MNERKPDAILQFWTSKVSIMHNILETIRVAAIFLFAVCGGLGVVLFVFNLIKLVCSQ